MARLPTWILLTLALCVLWAIPLTLYWITGKPGGLLIAWIPAAATIAFIDDWLRTRSNRYKAASTFTMEWLKVLGPMALCALLVFGVVRSCSSSDYELEQCHPRFGC